MFQVPAAVVSAGLIGRRGNAVECRESNLTGRASDQYLSMYSPGVLADTEVLNRQSSSIIIPEGSRYFISVLVPVYPGDICLLLGNFMPQDPYMFYVAFGRAFNLFVTFGPLLHHEKDFWFFWARTIIRAGELWYTPFITLLVPHHLDSLIHFPLALRKLYQYTDCAELSDLNLPNVEIIPKNHCVWRRTAVEMGPITEIQAAMASRLQESWGGEMGDLRSTMLASRCLSAVIGDIGGDRQLECMVEIVVGSSVRLHVTTLGETGSFGVRPSRVTNNWGEWAIASVAVSELSTVPDRVPMCFSVLSYLL
ncbi:hypothetical protein FIBSPDRAFT_901431 [Athelia psychrophila]|uniref:Uncharacterized protein n=1 Tax=Athelia psychrophila TaxID=1759441 RepID=A0A165X5X5_9AGAM|nr:hypothetical protein FIBSPDRAFT_901431 [Fibularhizoctonia sp. CBS 109695]